MFETREKRLKLVLNVTLIIILLWVSYEIYFEVAYNDYLDYNPSPFEDDDIYERLFTYTTEYINPPLYFDYEYRPGFDNKGSKQFFFLDPAGRYRMTKYNSYTNMVEKGLLYPDLPVKRFYYIGTQILILVIAIIVLIRNNIGNKTIDEWLFLLIVLFSITIVSYGFSIIMMILLLLMSLMYGLSIYTRNKIKRNNHSLKENLIESKKFLYSISIGILFTWLFAQLLPTLIFNGDNTYSLFTYFLIYILPLVIVFVITTLISKRSYDKYRNILKYYIIPPLAIITVIVKIVLSLFYPYVNVIRTFEYRFHEFSQSYVYFITAFSLIGIILLD